MKFASSKRRRLQKDGQWNNEVPENISSIGVGLLNARLQFVEVNQNLLELFGSAQILVCV